MQSIYQDISEADGVGSWQHPTSSISRDRSSAGDDQDGDWTDLDTVAGFRRTVMCESVRDEIKLNMGNSCSPETVKQLLWAICKGRLQPTTWLQKVRNLVYLL